MGVRTPGWGYIQHLSIRSNVLKWKFCFTSNSELYSRESIRKSKRISNPGCYATSSQLLIAPLVKHIVGSAWPTVFGISGYSGAGTVAGSNDSEGRPTTVPKVSPESLGLGIRPYALTDHIHEREAGFHLSSLSQKPVKVAFIPSVAPWFRGIISTLSIPLDQTFSAKEIRQLYEDRYTNERLIKITNGVPSLSDIENEHGWTVGGFQVHSAGDRAVVVVSWATLWIDHTLKSWHRVDSTIYSKAQQLNVFRCVVLYALRCVILTSNQNLNLALGYDEFAGIPLKWDHWPGKQKKKKHLFFI